MLVVNLYFAFLLKCCYIYYMFGDKWKESVKKALGIGHLVTPMRSARAEILQSDKS